MSPTDEQEAARRQALGVLARAAPAELTACWAAYAAAAGGEPAFTPLRGPETGLTMIRGRIGGSGRAFNIGETTITRCTLRTGAGRTGTAYVLGREKRQAEIAALVDALLQDPDTRAGVQAQVVAPLAAAQARAAREQAADTAATKVEFFTLVRGEER